MTTTLLQSISKALKARWLPISLLALTNLALGLGLGGAGVIFANYDTSLSFGLLGLLCLFLVRGFASYFGDSLSVDIFTQVRLANNERVFSMIADKLNWNSKSEVLDRLTTDVYNIIDGFSIAFTQGLSHLLLLICALSFTAVYAPAGLWIIAVGVILYSSLSLITKKKVQQQTKKMREMDTQIFTMEKNFIDGYEFLQSSGFQKNYFKKLISLVDQWKKNEKSRLGLINFTDSLAWVLRLGIVLLLASAMTTRMGINGMYFYWIFIAIGSISQIYSQFTHLYQLLPQYRRGEELLREKPSSFTAQEHSMPSLVAENLEVKFDPKAESNVGTPRLNFELQPGDFLWVKGKSGSGKTTLLRTLLGFHKNASGSIFLPQSASIAYVEQEPFLFEGESLLTNLGHTEASTIPNYLVTGLGLEDFMQSLPHGYKTIIGTESFRPSKGQARRLAFLRALLMEPTVLVLDEPTAGLNDELALATLNFMKSQCLSTILLVADHRTETLKQAKPNKLLDLSPAATATTVTENTIRLSSSV